MPRDNSPQKPYPDELQGRPVHMVVELRRKDPDVFIQVVGPTIPAKWRASIAPAGDRA